MTKYKPPKSGKTFVEKWNLFLPQVTARDNFTEAHLSQLKILCSLYQEFDDLSEKLEESGYSYEAYSTNGSLTVKAYPEVSQLNVCRSQIAIYTRMLGLMLVKSMAPVTNNQNESWD